MPEAQGSGLGIAQTAPAQASGSRRWVIVASLFLFMVIYIGGHGSGAAHH